MLLYYSFWIFMGFILHIYIIFRTNLLTGGPTRIVVFFAYFSVSKKSKILNGVQTEWNLRERDFWNERDPEDLECKPRSSRGGHEGGGRAHPYRVRPPISWAPRAATDLLLPPIYTHVPRKHPGSQQKTTSTTVTFCIREISSWSLRRHSAGGGIDHGGLLNQHHSPSDELWVVYHRPSGP